MSRATRDSNLVTQNFFVHYQHPLWYPLGETEENEEGRITVPSVVQTFQTFAFPKMELDATVLTASF